MGRYIPITIYLLNDYLKCINEHLGIQKLIINIYFDF